MQIGAYVTSQKQAKMQSGVAPRDPERMRGRLLRTPPIWRFIHFGLSINSLLDCAFVSHNPKVGGSNPPPGDHESVSFQTLPNTLQPSELIKPITTQAQRPSPSPGTLCALLRLSDQETYYF